MHNIEYFTFTGRKSTKTIGNECQKYAEKATWEDGGHGLYFPVRFIDRVCDSYDEACSFINRVDRGDYDSIGVRYKDGRAKKWLVKIEYHT